MGRQLMAVVTFGSICQQHYALIFCTGGKVLYARKSSPPSHWTPREVVPFVSELKVCQLTDWFRGINQGLGLQRALSALRVGGPSMQSEPCRAQARKA